MGLKKFFYDDGKDTKTPSQPATPSKPTTSPTVWQHTSDDDDVPTQPQPKRTIDFDAIAATAPASDLKDARDHFAQVLAKNNQPGNDYFELSAMVKVMSNLPVEAQRYQTAFAGLQVAGLTKEIVEKSAQYYISVIDQELKGFNDSMDQVFKQRVDDNKALIDQKSKQMTTLSQQISQLNDEIKKLQDEVSDSESSLSAKRNAFTRAGQEAKDNITNELNKINTYIQ